MVRVGGLAGPYGVHDEFRHDLVFPLQRFGNISGNEPFHFCIVPLQELGAVQVHLFVLRVLGLEVFSQRRRELAEPRVLVNAEAASECHRSLRYKVMVLIRSE